MSKGGNQVKQPQASVTARPRVREVAEGLVSMNAPEGATSCSFDGVEYEVSDDQTVDIPAAAVAELLSHGYTTGERKEDK